MRRAQSIELSTEERKVLENTIRSSRSAVRDVLRANIVLLAAAGWESCDIAAKLGIGQDTVSKWGRRYAQQRPKSAMGLKAPMRALVSRRSSERRLRSRSSMSMTVCSQGSQSKVLSWAARP